MFDRQLSGMFNRQQDVESGALLRLTIGINGAAVRQDDLFAKGETDAGAFVLITGIESLEYGEDLFGEGGVEADAVIGDVYCPERSGGIEVGKLDRLASGYAACADADDRSLIFGRKFQGVADEVIEELVHLQRHGFDYGQLKGFYRCVFLFDDEFEVFFYFFYNGIEVYGLP